MLDSAGHPVSVRMHIRQAAKPFATATIANRNTQTCTAKCSMKNPLQPVTFANRSTFQPLDLAPKWSTGVVAKVRAVHAGATSGKHAYRLGDYYLPLVTGILDLTGHREGVLRTGLLILFADLPDLPAPAFQIDDQRAVGILAQPSGFFGAFLHIAHHANAHFRISSNGQLNALATDPSVFEQLLADSDTV